MNYFYTPIHPHSHSPRVVRFAVDLAVPQEARRLLVQRGVADAAPEAGRVPRAAANVEQVLVGDRFAARGAGAEFLLK